MSVRDTNKLLDFNSNSSSAPINLISKSKKKKPAPLVDRFYAILQERNDRKNETVGRKRAIAIVTQEPQELPPPSISIVQTPPPLPVLTPPLLSSSTSVGLTSKDEENPKKRVSVRELLQGQNKELDRRRRLDTVMHTAKSSSPLLTPIKRLNCFTTYTEGHSQLIEKHFDALMRPPQSVAPLLTPLRSFAKQLPVTDPTFTFFISPKGADTLKGRCSHKKKSIHLLDSESTRLSTTLLHELSHLAINKLGWKQKIRSPFRKQVLQEALKDIEALSATDWKLCDPAVKEKLSNVPTHYNKEKQWEEYIVRVPQIISQIAQDHPNESADEIEARINRDIPRLYKIYKETFLPQLRDYVAKRHTLCTVKTQQDARKVMEELRSVLQRRMTPEEEATKDSRVVGLSFELPQTQLLVAPSQERRIVEWRG